VHLGETFASLRRKMYYLLGRIPEKQYPLIVCQRALHEHGITFEASNQVEEWRVRELDDEKEFLGLLLEEICADDVFLDVGACVGIFALHAAGKCRHVVAFEPDPGFQNRIRRNIDLNNVLNITVVPEAVSDSNGEMKLYTGGVVGRSPSLRDFGQGESITVRTCSIDLAVKSGEIPPPNVVKIDIEGAEYLALKGMGDLLSSPAGPRAIFIEIHPVFLKDFGATAEDVISFMESRGYERVYRRIRDNQEHGIFRKAARELVAVHS